MMKKMCLFILAVAVIQGSLFSDLTLLQPHGGEALVIGSTFTIQWTAPAGEGEQQVDIYLGEQLIADHSKKKEGSYSWVVGRLKNGSYVAPGHYKIVLESLDGDAFGKGFSLIAMPPLLIKIYQLEVLPLPDECPNCYQIDLREIKKRIKIPRERFHLKLFSSSRLIADLGQVGGRSVLPDFAKIRIPNEGPAVRKRTGSQYEIKLCNARGKVVETQGIKLVFKRRQ